MVDTISLEDISSAIESTDYSSPESVKDLERMINQADTLYSNSTQYDVFMSIRKKYQDKLKNPKAPDAETRASAGTDNREFDAIKGNQERREYLENKINQEGELILSPNESAFLAEQIVKGEMYDELKDGDRIVKISKALDVQSVADRAYEQAMGQMKKTEQSYMTSTGSTYVADSENSFAKQVLKDLNKADTKDTMFELEQQANLLSANIEAYGYTSGNLSAQRDLAEKIKTLQESSTGILNFNTRRKLNSQLKKIDPAYYETKTVYANAFTRPYYKARVALNNRSEKKTQKLEKRFERVTELKSTVNDNPFWSRHMGKNIAARAKLFGNCLATGRLTAQGVAKKYSKRLDITKSGQHLENIEAKIAELKSNAPDNKKGREKLAIQLKMYEAQKALFAKQADKKSSKRKTKLDALKTQVSPAQQKIKTRIEKMAQNLEAARMDDIKSSDKYKALVLLQSRGNLNAEQKKELDAIMNGLNEKKITADRVYEEILRNEGYSGEALEAKKKELFPVVEAQKTETTETIEQTEKKKKIQEENTDEVTKLNTIIKSETRESGEEVITYASGLEVSKPDENTYNLSGKDGKNPTDEQCAEFAGQLKNDGFESFAMAENVSKEFYDSMVRAAEAQGITIENKAEMDNKFAKETLQGQEAEGQNKDESKKDGVERTDDGQIKLTKAQRMALDAEGRLEQGGLNQKINTWENLDSQNRAYLEELGLGDKHIKDMLKKEAKEGGLTEAQQQMLDAEGRNIMGGEKKSYDELHSQDKAYLEDEGLGKDYNRKVERSKEFMIDANISTKDITVEKMDLLAKVQDMNSEDFKKFQSESDEYKKLPPQQRKLVDVVNGLKNNQEFNSKDDKKQAVMLGRVVSQYKSSVEKEGAKDKQTKQRIIDRNITRHIKQGNSNG